ncbi:serine/threonine protein kinase [Desulfobaculum sp. SPO524]|uniref:serine/threonine protein kinase n=1 Tax=Desulfobaculum sp. SPO524 TaxID=3378071 RepID=UPI0038522EB4
MSQEVRDLVRQFMPDFPLARCGKLYTDTTEFMDISYGDVMLLGGLHYMVLKEEVERRYGLEDPKYWVKRCRVLETGERRIAKLVFHENFPLRIGAMEVRCFRSPEKEARILNLVRGDRRFMQGQPLHDSKGNIVRLLEIVHGRRLDSIVDGLEVGHREYFFQHLPGLLEKFIEAAEAIDYLHSRFEKHGDIRRDHLLIQHGSGRPCWIDFDYTFDFQENPFGLDLFGLGNILVYLVGQGDLIREVFAARGLGTPEEAGLEREDFSIVFANRVVNLRKLYPYIPEPLNNVLMHFSAGTYVFYESVEEFLAELRPCVPLVRRMARQAG